MADPDEEQLEELWKVLETAEGESIRKAAEKVKERKDG